MYRIRTFNKISPVGLNRLDPALYAVSDSETDEDAILVRSAKLLDYDFPKNLLAISRAGAGVNNIPLDRCSEAGIVVFNTPGANANAVKELVLCAMLMGSRDVDGGIQWVRQQVASGVDVTTVVEKGKAAFIGPELYKKTLGVIGLGAIGSLVANIALSLGMDVYGYDPFLSVDAALRLDRHIHVVKDINELYKRADYITIHIHYTEKTAHMIDETAISAMKRGVRFINLARGEIVDDDAMLAALDTGWVAAYVTDFPNNRLVGAPHVLAMPHLGASTPESEQNCAVMAVDQLREQGVKAGLVKIRVFRPFPAQELAQALQHVKALAIMDKAESFSANGGPLFSEVRGALYDLEPRPRTVGYVYGLGGRDITPAHFHTVFARLQAIAAGGELGPVYTHLGQRG